MLLSVLETYRRLLAVSTTTLVGSVPTVTPEALDGQPLVTVALQVAPSKAPRASSWVAV